MMHNGDAFRAFTEEVITELSQVTAVDYYIQPMPSELDGRIQAIITRFMAATATERNPFQQSLPPEIRSLFGIFGHRAATLAARNQSADWLQTGLVGFTIANYIIPKKRKVELGLAVYHHVARKLELNPIDLFETAAQFGSPEIALHLLTYGRRTDITLIKFGWQEQKTPDGVKYKSVLF
jgi:hypothetical protein